MVKKKNSHIVRQTDLTRVLQLHFTGSNFPYEDYQGSWQQITPARRY